jgi:hypothetical protein
LWDVATGDECERNSDAEDKGGNAVDERDERGCRAEANFGERENYIVHDDVESNAEEAAVYPRMTSERKPAAGEKEDGGGGEGDEEVAEQPDEGRSMTHAKCGATIDSACDALKNPDWRYAAESIEDEGVGEVEYTDEEGGTGDDLPERGRISGHFHLE